jgi:hypothetical protein
MYPLHSPAISSTLVVHIWFLVGWNLEPLHWQLARFAQYVAGIVAYRCNWFAGLAGSQSARTSTICVRVWL